MRRGSIFQLLGIGLVAAVISTAVALLVPWLPPAASREAGRIDFAYWFATVIALVVFSVVAAIVGYCVINFRVDANDFSEDGPPTHGNTRLEGDLDDRAGLGSCSRSPWRARSCSATTARRAPIL